MENAISLTRDQARAAWIDAQGLGAGGDIPAVLERSGFVRTIGGVDVYLAVKARIQDLSRADLDGAVVRSDAQVVPAARGCIYLVPRRHVPLALRVAEGLSSARDQKDAERAGIAPGEVEDVAKAAYEVIRAKGATTTDALRRAMPEGSVRSLGERGKKAGVSSPLPLALRRLELEGRIERTLEGGRLDSDRYLWRATKKNPFEGARLPEDRTALWAKLAEVFFEAAGAARLSDFSEWAGLTQRDAKAAIAKAPLAPVTIDGDPGYALESRASQLAKADGKDAVALLSFEDNLMALHGGAGIWIDPAHHDVPAPSWGSSKPSTLGAAKHLALRAIVAEGMVRGFWEYDPASKEIALGWLDAVSAAAKKKVEARAEALAKLINDELGHGRSFNLDTDEELAKRAKQVRAMRPTRRRAGR